MRPSRPFLLLSLATVAGVAILLSLGFWQLERAAQREQQRSEVQMRRTLTAVYITRLPPEALDELHGRRVRLLGAYQERQFLLDNQVRDKRPGYQVLTPFETAHHHQLLLVDRGWIPQGALRRRTPRPAAPGPRRRQIEGTLHRTARNPFTDAEHLFEGPGWPQVAQEVDYARFAERLGELELLPIVLRLHPDQADGFRRDWPAPPMTAEKHLAYAVQWFAMAGVFALLMLGILWRLHRRH